MKTSRISVIALAATALFGGAPARVCAQVVVGAPIRVKVRGPKTKQSLFKGEVLHADGLSMIVRDRKDPRFIRTFTYSPKVKEKMEKILARGGYQYGDKVEIRYEAGEDVALAIRGKPSKPL